MKPLFSLAPMMLRFAELIFWLMPAIALADNFKTLDLSKDGSKLVVTTSNGIRFDAPKLTDQTGYSQPKISPDGKHAGWLALYPNCCTSYPVPLELIVLDQSGKVQSFVGNELSVFSWCFLPDAASVAYAQSVLHGSDFMHFEWRAIADQRLLATYVYPHEETDNAQARKQAPAWVNCVPD